MHRFAKWLLSIVTVVAVLLGIATVSWAVYTRHQAAELMGDISHLDALADPVASVDSLRRKHERQFAGVECHSEECRYEFSISNGILSVLHLAPRADLHAWVALYRNTLDTASVQYTSAIFKKDSPIVQVQEDFCAGRADITCNYSAINPHGRDAAPIWNGIVEFGQLAPEEQKRAAWALNLDCITAFHGCKDISELLPAIWRQTSPGTVSSRIANSDPECKNCERQEP